MAGPDRKPLSEDALNRYRITHPDRDLRPLLRRLHRLPYLPSTSPNDPSTSPSNSSVPGDQECEREMIRLELYKWRASVERIMGSVANLARQREIYLRRAEETAARAEALHSTLAQEKELLAKRLKERDHRLQCDEVAGRITAKGKSRQQLDEQIASLQQEVAEQAASHATFVQMAADRVEIFARIGPIVQEVRDIRLPVETNAVTDDKMEVDEPAGSVPPSGPSKLSAAATPFQPSSSSRSGTPPSIPTAPARPAPISSGSVKTSAHNLPARPSRSNPPSTTSVPSSRSGSSRAVSNLPLRPSNLRSSTMSATGKTGGLEEGELGGDEEDGEVAEERSRSMRSTRSRK